MTGFELLISAVVSDRSTNWATTTALTELNTSIRLCFKDVLLSLLLSFCRSFIPHLYICFTLFLLISNQPKTGQDFQQKLCVFHPNRIGSKSSRCCCCSDSKALPSLVSFHSRPTERDFASNWKKLVYHRISSNTFWRLSGPHFVCFLSNQSPLGLRQEASALSSPSRTKIDSNLVRNFVILPWSQWHVVQLMCLSILCQIGSLVEKYQH